MAAASDLGARPLGHDVPRPPWLALLGTRAAILIVLVVALLELDALCMRVWLPVVIAATPQGATLRVGTEVISLGKIGQPVRFELVPHNPLVHEYQIDGTDSTNNYTLDPNYLTSIEDSPYYRFQAWMRNLDGTSAWRDLTVTADGRPIAAVAQPDGVTGRTVALPAGARTVTMRVYLQRPETPMALSLAFADGSALQITLDRNDRKIMLTPSGLGAAALPSRSSFFPDDPAPFGAMVVDFLVRTLLWACLVALAVLAVDALAAAVWARVGQNGNDKEETKGVRVGVGLVARAAAFAARHAPRRAGHALVGSVVAPRAEGPQHSGVFQSRSSSAGRDEHEPFDRTGRLVARGPAGMAEGPLPPALRTRTLSGRGDEWSSVPRAARRHFTALSARLASGWSHLTAAIHPLGLFALAVSFGYTVWIALAEYRALPHIFDAVAYVFGAKMYASGQLSVPLPPALDRFPGPFMVQHAGRWFTQYMPGTSAMLALGMRLGVPWLVEPVMGALALLAIGLTAARLYDRRVATLAVLLGVLSPFYSYLAASYMSHAIALCFLAWGFWALVRFAQGGAGWNLPLAAALFGMGALTRDAIAALFTVIVVAGVGLLYLPRLRWQWRRWLLPGLAALAVGLLFLLVRAEFNELLTGNASLTPRALGFPDDRIGFGQGIGFYGQHTLAAGFVTEDELLTALAIDLYGWPFYLTLCFLALPFLLWRAKKPDWLLLTGVIIMTGVFIGYFYHGIYLGPRYLFETLPFLLPLTARGILTLAAVGRQAGRAVGRWLANAGFASGARVDRLPTLPFSLGTGALLAALLACNLIFYTPRQIALHQYFTGFPAGSKVDTAALGHPPFHHAIIVTDDGFLYGFTLFALNDPNFRGDVLYAMASTPADYQELRTAYPGRAIYQIHIAADGAVSYQLIPG